LRQKVASRLLDSLDETVDEAAEEEWNKEIVHRIQELDSGRGETDFVGRSEPPDAAILNGR
jgi:hypothetical protein